MKPCSSAVCVLVLLITTGSESSFTSVTVKLHDSATLPCAGRCSGVVRWTALQKPTEVLAECDQTSCRSVKEGYQMNHDQYLKKNFSLIISKAEFNTKTWFTCKCDDRDLCEMDVETYTFKTTRQIEAGEPLVLEINISDPVEVLYNSTDGAGPFRVQICTVNGGSLQCKPEYGHRANLISIHPPVLELREMTPHDSGVYSIVDKQSGEDIRIYTVKVKGPEFCSTTVTVKLHDPATLHCTGTCPGVAKWTVYQKPTEVLAECNQTSCRSVKEGYQMIHDQYLEGKYPLIITKADYSTKTWFTCKCDARNICEVDVQTYGEGYVVWILVGCLVFLVCIIVVAVVVVCCMWKREACCFKRKSSDGGPLEPLSSLPQS